MMFITRIRNQVSEKIVDVYKIQEDLLVSQVSQGIEKGIKDIEAQLQLMAVAPEIINSSDRDTCNAKLQEFFEITNYHLGNLGRVNSAGIFDCSLNKALISTPASNLGSYVNELIEDPEHRTVLSHKIKPPGIVGYAAAIHVPVYDKNQNFTGTVGGAIYFNQVKDQYLQNIRFGNDGFAILYDDNGDILYHPDEELLGKNITDPDVVKRYQPNEILTTMLNRAKSQGSGRYEYAVDGIHKVAAYKTVDVPGRKMVAVVTLPLEEGNNVVNAVGLNRAFPTVNAILAISIGLVTFILLWTMLKTIEFQNAKDQFISLVSHQLRTPATAVKQSLGVIKEGYTESPEQVTQFINEAYESNEDQLVIIDDILNVAKIDAGKLELRPEEFNLTNLSSEVIRELHGLADAKSQTIETNLPNGDINITADKLKVKMSIQNLLSNAIKYTPEKGTISISMADTSKNVLLSVEDNGIGISQADSKNLFKKFGRISTDQTAGIQGTGLGLYLVKQFIEMHGGDITMEQVKPHGTRFTISLPKNPVFKN